MCEYWGGERNKETSLISFRAHSRQKQRTTFIYALILVLKQIRIKLYDLFLEYGPGSS